MGRLARHHLFAQGARLKADLHKIIEESSLTVKGFEQGRPDLMRRLMFEHLSSVKDDGLSDDVNPFKTGNLTQQGLLLKTDPDRAARLKAEAGRI